MKRRKTMSKKKVIKKQNKAKIETEIREKEEQKLEAEEMGREELDELLAQAYVYISRLGEMHSRSEPPNSSQKRVECGMWKQVAIYKLEYSLIF